jgi:starch synthase (maltosyl-transferring)
MKLKTRYLMENLIIIKKELEKLRKKNRKSFEYKIPSVWQNPENTGKIDEVKPFDYFLEAINAIENAEAKNYDMGNTVIYNMFPRLSAAYRHSGEETSEDYPFRNTGTFLKALAMLPYIKSLGANIIYLLPVTSVGIDEKKGNLGSPYAIRNPYKLDENLTEPFLESDIETQFAAFVEAAHAMGMKVITEFVFRTASIDSDLALEHPEWFYWIKARVNNRGADKRNEKQYGPPLFTKEELEKIREKIEKGDMKRLPKPHQVYRDMFTKVPPKVARVEDKIRGLIDKKTEVRIPGAFADWPPDDTQPVWSDVTYLRLYDEPKFNYIAYNTVRMYDSELAKEDNKVSELWDFIIDIIPYFRENFGIDGVMIDMGHALPSELREEIVKAAREENPDFMIWEENFSITQKSADEGYDSVVGYLPFDCHVPGKMKSIIRNFQENNFPLQFFGTAENHNTPRAASREGNIEFSKIAWLMNAFLPLNTFIHSGFELGESNPVNTGLGFSESDYEKYPAEKLGLFSEVYFDWENPGIVDFIRQINSIRNDLVKDADSLTQRQIVLLESGREEVVAFLRRDTASQTEILVAANFSGEPLNAEIDLLTGAAEFTDSITGIKYNCSDGKLSLVMKPFGLMAGKIDYEDLIA